MNEDPPKAKRKAKTEDVSDKKPRLDSSTSSFEVQPEVENFQREALWRSLQDYKRRAAQSQEQLDRLKRTSQYHDDHLRLIDIWWDQVIDEVNVATRVQPSQVSPRPKLEEHFLDTESEFVQHIEEKRRGIINSIKCAVQSIRRDNGELVTDSDLEAQNQVLSARLKLAESSVRTLQFEKEEREPKIAELQERLASSQRKIDRQKSITLARIEQQARRAPSSPQSAIKVEEDTKDVLSKSLDPTKLLTNGHASSEHMSLKAANQKLVIELGELQSQLSEANTRVTNLTQQVNFPQISDIEKSVAYQTLRKSNEQLRGMNEYLESTRNIALEEASNLKAERSSFQETLLSEHNSHLEEVVANLTRTEQDLARVRSARDDLHSSLQLRKSQDDAKSTSAREISELADTQATRISALEAEIARLKKEFADDLDVQGDESEIPTREIDELWARFDLLRKENRSLKNELPTMEKAFNQAHDQSMRKLMDLAASEEKLARLQAEKSKADQKYFAAMKAKDQVVFEVKALKLQNSKSSETIARLHEFEETGKLTIQNLERQIANWENTCDKYKTELSRLTTTNEKLTIEAGATATQLLEVTKQADLREADLCNTIKSRRHATQELAELQAQYDTLKDATPTKSVSQDSDQLQVYRGMAMCSVCNTRWKSTALSSCGHIFCKECVDKRLETRQRRCPSCNKGFGTGDVLSVHL